MSEESTKKRKSMMQRLATAVPLVAALIVALAVGGWLMALVIAVCLAIALYEELHALQQGGYKPVWWTSFAALFVAVPLPGTGAWTGSLVAALMEMRLKHSLISAFGGVVLAGAIVTLISYGALGFLQFLL